MLTAATGVLLTVLAALLGLSTCASAGFLCDLTQPLPEGVPETEPWKVVPLDPDYSGQWVILEDVNGDGEIEVISARNVNVGDVHYTSAVVVHRLDGSVLWRWGGRDLGRSALHHDVACQVHDWDRDGRPEVVVCGDGELIALDGANGSVKVRYPLPPQATDCLVFANLSGGPAATDVLVKDRYDQIWAYDRDWNLLWTVKHPGGYRTAHQPYPLDLDGDGCDEIVAGYAVLYPDGAVRWTLSSKLVDLRKGHLDCCRVMSRGERPEDWRLLMTTCGSSSMVMTDGCGKTIWEQTGLHFESLDVGNMRSDVPGPQIAVDDGHHPTGRGPVHLYDAEGTRLGTWVMPYARFHTMLDWNGDGLSELLLPDPCVISDGFGKPLVRLKVEDKGMKLVRTGDFTGDGVVDFALSTPTAVYIFRNPSRLQPSNHAPLGSGRNATLY